MQETSPVTVIKGIGPKSALNFEKAGIRTVGDLIHYYPRSYDRYEAAAGLSGLTAADEGRVIAVEGRIERELSVRFLSSIKLTTGKIIAGDGSVDVTWYNMPYLRTQLKPGTVYIFRGTIRLKGKRIFLQQPKVYDLFDYAALRKNLQPVYPLVKGLTENALRKALQNVFYGPDHIDLSEDCLPAEMLERYDLQDLKGAVRTIHFPQDEETLKRARKRLVFDEFFFFILMLKQMRAARTGRRHDYRIEAKAETQTLLSALPYQLTGAQKRAWETISGELAGEKLMARLIQGDVGSGKTILAFLAMIQTAANGMQSALMVPTEVLARQHQQAFDSLCENAGLPYRALLLTGSLKASEKKKGYSKAASGESPVIIGTHALIQEKLSFRSLALVITDEQHRFGVQQRESLEKKGEAAEGSSGGTGTPHTLVMSATPIPRTLAVILYGDLDVSVLDELPAGRLPVKNAVVDSSWRPRAWRFIAEQVRQGHQAYVICPMVEGSDEIEAENVIEYTAMLREELQQYLQAPAVEYLHGRMKPLEKADRMERFASGEISVLVSTTVIEVGVNVPNATVIMIENSERFGLAQLHQLRGRVGRGKDQSWCIFMHTACSDEISRRLEILSSSNDGFEIAARDLELRGPGELFGVRQSGELAFQLADIYADAPTMRCAEKAAEEILILDPDLSSSRFRTISRRLQREETGGKSHYTL
jgi:ATP-dependent DNA helicase RecG